MKSIFTKKQTPETSAPTIPTTPASGEQSQAAVFMQRTEMLMNMLISMVNEMARMELNISRMDPDTKGRKQLLKSIERMKLHLKSSGIEVPQLLGQPYDAGLRADVQFVADETLPQGAQIITSVVRPQININGMIAQKAEIIVSQNI